MRERKYPVQLSEEQWNHLNSLLRQGQHSSRKLNPAGVLLLCYQGKGSQEIAQIIGISLQAVHNIRKRLVQPGLEMVLNEEPHPGAPKKLGVKGEAYAIASACSQPQPVAIVGLCKYSRQTGTTDICEVYHGGDCSMPPKKEVSTLAVPAVVSIQSKCRLYLLDGEYSGSVCRSLR